MELPVASRKDTELLSHLHKHLHKGLLLPALLACVAWLAGAYLLDRNVIASNNASSVTAAAQEQADRYAQQLGQALKQRAERLQQLDLSGFRDAELNGDPVLPGGAAAQFFAPQQVRVGAGKAPQLNFALVDLLKRALGGSRPPVEILRTGSDNDWQLHSVFPVQGGAVLVTEEFNGFEGELQELDGSLGEVVLAQKFPDGPSQSLWQTGQGIPQHAAVSAKVEGSHLSVQFQPSAGFAREFGISAMWTYLLALVGLTITLALIVRFVPRKSLAPWERGVNSGPKARGSANYPNLGAESGDGAAAASLTVPNAPKAGRNRPNAGTPSKSDLQVSTDFPPHVFRAYDIRGIAGSEINEPFAYQLGRALGTLAQHVGEEILLVGRDGRNTSEVLADCLIEGIRDSGCNSVNLGLVPSPLLYYACAKGKNTSSGVVVTASHNPADYNGFKILLRGRPLSEEKLQQLRKLMQQGPFKSGEGSNREQDITEDYIDEIFNDVALAGQPHLVIDAGNGATSLLAPRLFEQLGCIVEPLFCSIDGNFPNHPPDPTRTENLRALIDKVSETGADLGVALDGDGDRVTLITSSGRIAWADQLLMLLARDVLVRNPGEDIVFDVKSTRALNELVNQYGGRPIMWKTGHAPMKTKMLETGAILGGELSGHIFIKDRWFGFDDGIYAAARILEIMALREQSLDELLDSLPQLVSTPELLLPVAEQEKFALVKQLREQGDFPEADINDIDGLRFEYSDGWGLVRASNTGAALTLRFEAETDAALQRIQSEIMAQLNKVAPHIGEPS